LAHKAPAVIIKSPTAMAGKHYQKFVVRISYYSEKFVRFRKDKHVAIAKEYKKICHLSNLLKIPANSSRGFGKHPLSRKSKFKK
jgi:hypothetical protein